MNRAWAVYGLARADLLERTRRYQYLATIVVTLLAGTLLVPPKGANYAMFVIDGYRGIYNSPWIGATFALLASLLLSLFGFYNVKSAVQRDRDTRVGEIIASTSLGRLDYAIGKALSNFLVLGSMTAILFIVAVAMQLVRGESTAVDLGQIAAPFALVVVPTTAITAAVALFFEMIPLLRGGFGNVVYFFGWVECLYLSFSPETLRVAWWRDLFGGSLIMQKVWGALKAVDPRAKPDSVAIGAGGDMAHHYFVFSGFSWSAGDVFGRLAWLLIALAIVAAAALAFDRFSRSMRSTERASRNGVLARSRAALARAVAPLLDLAFPGAFGAIVLAELRLLVGGLSFWWYVVAVGLFVAQIPVDTKALSIIVGIAWIWPLLSWSQLGTREAVFATEQFVYPTLHPVRRHFVAQWLAGVILALLTAGGALIHWGLAGNLAGIEGILAGALFVPTLALACGALSGTTRLFEIVYLIVWYAGPMNRTSLDFTQGAYAPGFALAACVLFAVAITARKMRLAIA